MRLRDEVLRKSTPADEKEVRAMVPRYESRSGRLLREQETQLARRSARGATEGRSLRMSTLVDEKGHATILRNEKPEGSTLEKTGRWVRVSPIPDVRDHPSKRSRSRNTRTRGELNQRREHGPKFNWVDFWLRGARNCPGRPEVTFSQDRALTRSNRWGINFIPPGRPEPFHAPRPRL